MKKKRIFINITALILFLGLSYLVYIYNQKNLTLVVININPDIQLVINEDNIVEEVLLLNEEADIITSDIKLIGTDIDTATERIIDASIDTGFIDEYGDENTIIVTTINEEEQIRKKTENKVISKIQEHLQIKKIYSLVVANGVNDEIKKTAKELDVSNGKMLLINRATIINEELSKEELAALSVKEIQELIKEYVSERYEAKKESLEELKEVWKEEKESLKKAHKKSLEDLKTSFLEKVTEENVKDMKTEEKDKLIEKKMEEKKEQIKEKINQVRQVIGNSLNDAISPEEIRGSISNTMKIIRNKGN